MLDQKARKLIAEKPNLIVPWFLMASFLYYHRPESFFSDGYYDELAKELLDNWDNIEHSHKNLIPFEDLGAGSLYRLSPEDYPSMCKGAALYLVETMKGK